MGRRGRVDHDVRLGVRGPPGSPLGRPGAALGRDRAAAAADVRGGHPAAGDRPRTAAPGGGCGSGVFLAAAAGRGATVSGLDASERLVKIARRRVPAADVRVGDMERLPFADDAFDVVAGFNAFFFADDMTAALREAARVARPGAPVLIQVWGRPERCELEAFKVALGRLMPGPGRQAPPPFWRAGVLEDIASAAGLTPERTFDCRWAYEYADEPAMVRSMLAVAG